MGANHAPSTSHSRTTKVLALGLSLVALSIWSSRDYLRYGFVRPLSLHLNPSGPCSQATAITPSKHALIWESLLKEAAAKEYKNMVVKWLGGAIQIEYVRSPTLAHFDRVKLAPSCDPNPSVRSRPPANAVNLHPPLPDADSSIPPAPAPAPTSTRATRDFITEKPLIKSRRVAVLIADGF